MLNPLASSTKEASQPTSTKGNRKINLPNETKTSRLRAAAQLAKPKDLAGVMRTSTLTEGHHRFGSNPASYTPKFEAADTR